MSITSPLSALASSGFETRLVISPPHAPRLRLAAWHSPGGEPPGFVFLHAIGLSHHSWLPAARLVARRHPVLALTMAGFGESDLASDGDYSLRTQAARALAAADTVEFERAVLVGNSLGGAVAQAAALAEPERTAALVLVSPAINLGGLPVLGKIGHLTPAQWALWAAPAWAMRAGLVVGSGSPGWTTLEHGLRCQATFRRPGGGYAFAATLRALYSADAAALAEEIPSVRCPVMILRGSRDPLIPRSLMERLAGAFHNARLVSLPRLGHFAQEEEPGLVAGYCLRAAESV